MLQGIRWRLRRGVEQLLLRREWGYRRYLRRRYGVTAPRGRPDAPWHNAVLQDRDELEAAVRQVGELGLFVPKDRSKCWDSLAALDAILRDTDCTARVLDAGAALYSVVLPWLFVYGYTDLTGINLIFGKPVRRGPIRYGRGDITGTDFEDASFDAVTCLSVVEHGVDLRRYFREMSRILKPGAVLVTSADYYERPVATAGRQAHGAPVHVFRRDEVLAAVEMAEEYGLKLTGPLDLRCKERPVRWDRMGLDFTYVVFSLRRH